MSFITSRHKSGILLILAICQTRGFRSHTECLFSHFDHALHLLYFVVSRFHSHGHLILDLGKIKFRFGQQCPRIPDLTGSASSVK